jgi:hypothetical protein
MQYSCVASSTDVVGLSILDLRQMISLLIRLSCVFFSAIPSLVTLVLEGTAVTDAGVIQYANSRPTCLQNLDLSRTSITQSCFSALEG